MDWAFKWGGLHSLTLGASLYNERAVAVYTKAGFRQEGVSKEVIYRNRKWWDTVQLSILEQEVSHRHSFKPYFNSPLLIKMC